MGINNRCIYIGKYSKTVEKSAFTSDPEVKKVFHVLGNGLNPIYCKWNSYKVYTCLEFKNKHWPNHTFGIFMQ